MTDNHEPDHRAAARLRRKLTPTSAESFHAFSKAVFASGALPGKTKQLIALSVAHVTQCPDCIRAHARAAKQAGANEKEILEAIWVAAEMRAGAAVAHSRLALEAVCDPEPGPASSE